MNQQIIEAIETGADKVGMITRRIYGPCFTGDEEELVQRKACEMARAGVLRWDGARLIIKEV